MGTFQGFPLQKHFMTNEYVRVENTEGEKEREREIMFIFVDI